MNPRGVYELRNLGKYETRSAKDEILHRRWRDYKKMSKADCRKVVANTNRE